jgi:beta-N-acetylhexosaminidase
MVGLPGPVLDPETRRRLAAIRPAGVILFGRNLESPAQVRELLASTRDVLAGDALFAIDQEGGSVSRLAPWIGETPSAATLARAGVGRVRAFGAATGAVVAALGFNLDFAPVVDLCPPDATNGIGSRSFGIDPATSTMLAGAFLDGLQGRGVGGCLKHFPGLGDTAVDSHVELPIARRGVAALLGADMLPFRELAHRAASIMVGHGHYPALVPGAPRPATCSREIVGRLRGDLEFRGLIVTDDMEMGAIGERDRDGTAAVEALQAGCDLLLYCADLDRAERATESIRREAERDAGFRLRVGDAAGRVARFVQGWPSRAGDGGAWHTACQAIGEQFSA